MQDEAAVTDQSARTLEWFKQELMKRGVSRLEIVWGDYIDHFYEIPGHLMDRYLHHRRSFLHKEAFEIAKREHEAIEAHPFSHAT